jgi:hypothetical protein
MVADLRREDPGTYALRIRARRSDGRMISVIRRYRTCRVASDGRPVNL